MASVAWIPQCPVCGIDKRHDGRQFRSERAVAYHMVGKARNEWRLGGGGHSRWIERQELGIDYTWRNNEISELIMQAVRGTTPEVTDSPDTTTDTVSVNDTPIDQAMKLSRHGERLLRQIVLKILPDRLGTGSCCWCDSDWWTKGIDESIRVAILQKREQRGSKLNPIFFASISELKQLILRKYNWQFFEPVMTQREFAHKEDVTLLLDRLNRVRNDVLHPREDDDHSFPNEDLQFLHDIIKRLWRVSERINSS